MDEEDGPVKGEGSGAKGLNVWIMRARTCVGRWVVSGLGAGSTRVRCQRGVNAWVDSRCMRGRFEIRVRRFETREHQFKIHPNTDSRFIRTSSHGREACPGFNVGS